MDLQKKSEQWFRHQSKVETTTISLIIWNLKEFLEKIRKIRRHYNLRRVFKSLHTLSSMFSKIKPKSKAKAENCIYELLCIQKHSTATQNLDWLLQLGKCITAQRGWLQIFIHKQKHYLYKRKLIEISHITANRNFWVRLLYYFVTNGNLSLFNKII